MKDAIYIIIIAELLFICAVFGYFVFKLRQRLRRLARQLNPAAFAGQSAVAVDAGVVAYLVGQGKKTRALPETDLYATLGFSPLVVTIRSAYLAAERRALKMPLDSQDYWMSLRDDIDGMIGLMSTEAKRAGVENIELKEKLKLLSERLEKLGDSDWLAVHGKSAGAGTKSGGYALRFGRNVDEVRRSAEKANAYGRDFSSKIDRQKAHVEKLGRMLRQEGRESLLERKIAEYERLLYKMERESADLQKALNEASRRIAAVDQMYVSAKDENGTLLSIVRSGDARAPSEKKLFEDLINDSRDIVVQGRNNIDGLQKTIFDQRKSILFMENAIEKLESELAGSKEGSEARKSELDSLKRALMESEGCIKVLESEVESLYASMQGLQDQRETFEQYMRESALARPAEAGDRLAASDEEPLPAEHVTGPGGQEFLNRFMADAIECGSLEDLITVLQQSVADLGYQSMIRLQVGTAKVEVCSMGRSWKGEAELLDSWGESASDAIESVGGNVYIKLRNIKAIIVSQMKNGSRVEADESHLAMLFGFSSSLAQKVVAQQSVGRRLGEYEYIGEMMQKISKNLEVQYNYQRLETKAIIQSILDQSSMLVGEHPTKAQQMFLDAMQKEVGQRVDLLDANRAMARNQFVKIMEKLKSSR